MHRLLATFQFAELVCVWGTGRELALPYRIEYLSEGVYASVQMKIKAKVEGEIDAELSVERKARVLRIPFFCTS